MAHWGGWGEDRERPLAPNRPPSSSNRPLGRGGLETFLSGSLEAPLTPYLACFLCSLYTILSLGQYDESIRWCEDPKTFEVIDVDRLCKVGLIFLGFPALKSCLLPTGCKTKRNEIQDRKNNPLPIAGGPPPLLQPQQHLVVRPPAQLVQFSQGLGLLCLQARGVRAR